MTYKLLKTCVLAAVALAFRAPACCGADSEGVSGAQFLRIGVGAEASALGETGAVRSGAQSLFYNPAGLASVGSSEIFLSQVQWVMETSYSNLSAATKLGKGVLGLAVSRLAVPSTDKYDKLGNKLSESYSAADLAAGLGYSHPLWPGAGLGVNLKYISSRLDDAKTSAMAVDAGVKWDLAPGLQLGAVLQNAGTKLKYLSEEESLPRVFKAGGGYTYKIPGDYETQKTASLFADVNYLEDAGSYANVGLQFTADYPNSGTFALRGGYRTDADSAAAASFGLGLSGPVYVIDYAYSAMGDLGRAHRLSLTLKFGGAGGSV